MAFAFNEDYRKSNEYIEWVDAIKRDYPAMPLYLIESCIMMHKTDPQYYKKAKDSKEIFTKAPKTRLNDGQKIIENAVTISDAPIEPTELNSGPSVIVDEVIEVN